MTYVCFNCYLIGFSLPGWNSIIRARTLIYMCSNTSMFHNKVGIVNTYNKISNMKITVKLN